MKTISSEWESLKWGFKKQQQKKHMHRKKHQQIKKTCTCLTARALQIKQSTQIEKHTANL